MLLRFVLGGFGEVVYRGCEAFWLMDLRLMLVAGSSRFEIEEDSLLICPSALQLERGS